MTSEYAPSNVPWKEIVTKAGLTAVVAGTAAALLLPQGTASVAGMPIPGSVAIGLGAATGSVVGDLTHKYVLPHIPQSEKYQGIETAAVSLIGASIGSYVGMRSIGEVPIMTPILLGGGSYFAADYIFHHIIDRDGGGFIY